MVDELTVEDLRSQVTSLQEHRNELYEALDRQEAQVRELQADVAELTIVSLEALQLVAELEEYVEELEADLDGSQNIYVYLQHILLAISKYEGKDARVPAVLAKAAIAEWLVPVISEDDLEDEEEFEDE